MIENLFGSIQTILIGLTALVAVLTLVRFLYNSASLAANPSADGSKKKAVGFGLLGLFVLIFASAIVFFLTSEIGINPYEGEALIEKHINI